MTTVLDIIDKGTSYLEKHGIEDARRNMQFLVAHQLGCSRMDLYVRFDQPIDEEHLGPLRENLKRRGKGVPLQHLLGTVFFRKHEFVCDGRALIPRPETEELAEWLAEKAEIPETARILDMGCGSGVLGLSLAADLPRSRVTLMDISASALELARENATRIGSANLDFVESDLFAGLAADASFDLIVANLPYVPESERAELSREVLHDPGLALFGGADGLDVIRRFVPEATARLNPGGLLALEIGRGQHGEVEEMLGAAGLTGVLTRKDLSGIPRFPIAKRPTA